MYLSPGAETARSAVCVGLVCKSMRVEMAIVNITGWTITFSDLAASFPGAKYPKLQGDYELSG